MKLKTKFSIYLRYDDGSGNTCLYYVDGFTEDELVYSDGFHYRPKIMGFLNPSSAITVTSGAPGSVVGTGHPATINVTVEVDGTFTLPSNVSMNFCEVEVSIAEVDNDLIPYDGLQQLFRGHADKLSTITVVQPNATSTSFANPEDAEVEEAFNELSESWTVKFSWDSAEEELTIGDCTFVVGAASLMRDTCYDKGRDVEKWIKYGLVLLNIQEENLGPLAGMVIQYTQDGEFAELDLPVIDCRKRLKVA